MVLTVLRRPLQRGLHERGRAEEEKEKAHDWRSAVGTMREQAVVARRDGQSRQPAIAEESLQAAAPELIGFLCVPARPAAFTRAFEFPFRFLPLPFHEPVDARSW